jgi:thiol-disulfide isomerase/thioredoxin
MEVAAPLPPEPDPPVPSVRRGWLGVELEALPDRSLAGVAVSGVIPESPAEQAGIVPGDVILLIDGQAVASPEQVVQLISAHAAGSRLNLALRRGASERLIAVALQARPDEDGVQRMRYVGLQAPAFAELQTAQGALDPTLGAHRGRVLLIEFWSPWCVACRMLVPQMNAWHARYVAQGTEVIGITTESVTQATAAAQQMGIAHPVFSDETGATTRAYRALAVPTLFVVDRSGVVRDVLVGYSEARIAEIGALLERLVAEP